MVRGPIRQTEISSGFSLAALMKAVLLALVVYVILAFLTTVVISLRSDLETKLPTLAQVAQYLAALIAGLAAGRKAARSGWLHGLGAGLAFMVVISAVGSIFLPVQVRAYGIFIWQLLPGAVLGLSGGALGANL
jgi:putative membrane protein (TIGR04086 family)